MADHESPVLFFDVAFLSHSQLLYIKREKGAMLRLTLSATLSDILLPMDP